MTTTYALCIDAGGYEASLQLRKVYVLLADPAAAARGLVRVIDESGEDYLFPDRMFVPVQVPEEARTVFAPTKAGAS